MIEIKENQYIDKRLKQLNYKSNSKEFGIIDSIYLNQLESKLKGKLPDDFKYFITNYSAGEFFIDDDADYTDILIKFPKPRPIPISASESLVNNFYGKVINKDNKNIWERDDDFFNQLYTYQDDRIPKFMLPFAGDGNDNQFLIDLSKENNGHIYFWDHEVNDNYDFLYASASDTNRPFPRDYKNKLIKVADSFVDFLKKLKLNYLPKFDKSTLIAKSESSYINYAKNVQTPFDKK